MQLLIDGKFVDARSGKVFGTEDPRTGSKLTDVAEAQKEDVDAAVKAARQACTPLPSIAAHKQTFSTSYMAKIIHQCQTEGRPYKLLLPSFITWSMLA